MITNNKSNRTFNFDKLLLIISLLLLGALLTYIAVDFLKPAPKAPYEEYRSTSTYYQIDDFKRIIARHLGYTPKWSKEAKGEDWSVLTCYMRDGQTHEFYTLDTDASIGYRNYTMVIIPKYEDITAIDKFAYPWFDHTKNQGSVYDKVFYTIEKINEMYQAYIKDHFGEDATAEKIIIGYDGKAPMLCIGSDYKYLVRDRDHTYENIDEGTGEILIYAGTFSELVFKHLYSTYEFPKNSMYAYAF